MSALQAQTRAEIDEVYTAGPAAGGINDGKLGIREAYIKHFYVAYLRDPIEYKVAILCNCD